MSKEVKEKVTPVQDGDNLKKEGNVATGNSPEQQMAPANSATDQASAASRKSGKKVSSNEERAKEIFATHPAERLYFTSDGEAFLKRNFAEIHARTLKDKGIETIEKRK